MESLIIHPQSQKDLRIIKAFLKAVEVPFEKLKKKPNPDNPSPSGDPWFDDPRNLAMVEKGLEDVKAGRVVELTPELQKELLGL